MSRPHAPFLALALLPALGLLIALGALLLRLQDMLFGPANSPAHPVRASSLPFALHLFLVLLAGLWIPGAVVAWFERAAAFLG